LFDFGMTPFVLRLAVYRVFTRKYKPSLGRRPSLMVF
jgi:hypothetical protein